MLNIRIILLLIFGVVFKLNAQWIDQGPGGQSLSSVSFYDVNNGWTCGAQGSLFRTSDGGATWQPVNFFNAATARNRLISVAHPQANRIVLVAEQASATQPTVAYYSQNNGASFTAIDNGTFTNIYFYNDTQGLLVGDNGTLRISTSGGALWTPVPSGTQNSLRDGNCASPQDCYVVGEQGTLRKSVNGITAWRALNSTTSARLNGVCFASLTHGYIVGDNGTALRTTDAGVTWSPMAVRTSVSLNDVYFLSPSTGFIVGELGTILLTTNGGLTWQPETTNTFESLYSISAAADGSVIRIAGGGGTVLRRGPVLLAIGQKRQTGAWQVYPNPFHAALRLTVPSTYHGKCQVRLLNGLGQLVYEKVLLSPENQHELVLPDNLASGIYYLQIQDGLLNETRRLVHLQ